LRYLLDTNVLSELAKKAPSPAAEQWFREHYGDDLLISAITVGEMAYWIERKDEGGDKDALADWFESVLLEWFAGAIVALDDRVAQRWAVLRAESGRTLPLIDSLIAASALASGCAVVTRNVKDFEGIVGLTVINPWAE